MEQEFKLGPLQEKWVSLLESGNFKQTKNKLKNPKTGGFCCLGVICEHVLDMEQVSYEREVEFTYGSYSDASCLPGESSEDMGLSGDTGEIELDYVISKNDLKWAGKYSSLADMNDKGVKFTRIAKFIRDNPRAVFDKPK